MEDFTLVKEIDIDIDDDDDEGDGEDLLLEGTAAELGFTHGRRHNAILYGHSRSKKRSGYRRRRDDDYWYWWNKRYPATVLLEYNQMPGALRREFEDTFCARLRMTNLQTFRRAGGCRVAYVYKPQMTMNTVILEQEPKEKEAVMIPSRVSVHEDSDGNDVGVKQLTE